MEKMFIDKKSVLVTGGTGSFGKKFILHILNHYNPDRVIVYSRDELKQFEMQQHPEFKKHEHKMRYFLGDVRDERRLERALNGVNVVIHAAALKQVPAAEYNPIEFIRTNVNGAENVINAAINMNVEKVVALSTDKACNPINLYGATKLCSDKLFVAGNSYAGNNVTRFAVVRYGNVVGSRGSVIPFFQKLIEEGAKKLPVTDKRMTRFWITLDQGVEFVLNSLEKMIGGELFIPKIPSMKIVDLAKAIAPQLEIEEIGIRPGEKLHEIMISKEDARQTLEFKDYFVIQPQYPFWNYDHHHLADGKPCKEDFSYTSDSNAQWVTSAELKKMIS